MPEAISTNQPTLVQIPVEQIKDGVIKKLGDEGTKLLCSFVVGVLQDGTTNTAKLAATIPPRQYTIENKQVKVALATSNKGSQKLTTVAYVEASQAKAPEDVVNGCMRNLVFDKKLLGISADKHSVLFYQEKEKAPVATTTPSDDNSKQVEVAKLPEEVPPAFPTVAEPSADQPPAVVDHAEPQTAATVINNEEVSIETNKTDSAADVVEKKEPETKKEEPQTSSTQEKAPQAKSLFRKLLDGIISILKLPFKPFVALYNYLTTKE